MTLGDLSVLIAAGTFLLGVIGTAFAFWRWVLGSLRASEAQLASTIRAMDAEQRTQNTILQAQADLTRSQLNEFKLEVAKEYAAGDRLEQMEDRFTAAIEKLINRFDAFATEFNRTIGRFDRDRDRDHGGP